MHDLMIVTSGEWVLFALAGIALIYSGVVCMNMRKTLIRAEARASFRTLPGSLSDLRQRGGRKTGRRAS